MKKLLLSVLLTLNFTGSVFSMEIEDPNDVMGEIEFFAEARSYKHEFKVGDMVKIESNACWAGNDSDGNETSGCDTTYSKNIVTKVTDNHAEYSTHYALKKSTYELIKKNPLRILTDFNEFQALMTKESFSENETIMKLVSATEEYSTTLGVSTLKIKLSLAFEEFELPLYIVIARGLPFAGQIAEFGIDKDLVELPSNWKPSYRIVDWLKFL